VTLTMPLATLLGSREPGDVPGYGLLPADDCRALATATTTPATTTPATATPATTAATAATAAAAAPGATPAHTRWCLTLTGDDGQAVAHGCATSQTGTPGGDGDWALRLTIRPLATGRCDHRRESAGLPAPRAAAACDHCPAADVCVSWLPPPGHPV
jgi:hypothetical protein